MYYYKFENSNKENNRQFTDNTFTNDAILTRWRF